MAAVASRDLIFACLPESPTRRRGFNGLFDARTGTLVRRFHALDDVDVSSACLSSDGSRLAVGDAETLSAYVLDTGTGTIVTTVPAPERRLARNALQVALSEDGRRLALVYMLLERASDGGHLVRVVSLDERRDLRHVEVPPAKNMLSPAVFASDLRHVFVQGYLVDLEGSTWRRLHDEFAGVAVFSADGEKLACVNYPVGTGESVEVFELASGKREVFETGKQPHELAFARDGRLLAADNADSHVRVWDACTGEKLWAFDFDPSLAHFETIAFTRDGSRITTFGRSGSLLVWDLEPR